MDQLCCGLRRYYDATVFNSLEPNSFWRLFSVAKLVATHAPNNINKTLFQLIENYMKIDRAPIYTSVFGPVSLSYHVSKTHKKMIYVFGELHNLPCNQACKKSMINVHDFISMQFAVTPAFTDCYIELPFIPVISQMTNDQPISEYLDQYFPDKNKHLGMIGRTQIECLDRGLRKKHSEKCRTGRRHYLDIRYNHDGIQKVPLARLYIDAIVNGILLLKGHERVLINISRRINWLDLLRHVDDPPDTALSELRISISPKSIAVWKILSTIAKVMISKDIESILVDLAVESPNIFDIMMKSTYLQKEIRRSRISNEIEEYINSSLEKILRKTYGRRKKYCKRYSSSISILEKIDSLTELIPVIRKIANIMMDSYLYARIFKEFTNAEEDCHPVSPSNIIVYVGEQHARSIRQFLSSLHFRELQSIKTSTPEKGLSLQEIPQPFFKDVARICGRI